MKIIITIPDQFFKDYIKHSKNSHGDIDLTVAAKMAVHREMRVYAAIYAKDIELTCELPKE